MCCVATVRVFILLSNLCVPSLRPCAAPSEPNHGGGLRDPDVLSGYPCGQRQQCLPPHRGAGHAAVAPIPPSAILGVLDGRGSALSAADAGAGGKQGRCPVLPCAALCRPVPPGNGALTPPHDDAMQGATIVSCAPSLKRKGTARGGGEGRGSDAAKRPKKAASVCELFLWVTYGPCVLSPLITALYPLLCV